MTDLATINRKWEGSLDLTYSKPYRPLVCDTVPFGPYAGQRFKNLQCYPLGPDTANFRDYGDRAKLGSIGIFSTDTKRHRAAAAARRGNEIIIDGAYAYIRLDRVAEHKRLAGQFADNSGIWPTSEGEYTKARSLLDQDVLATARRWGYTS